jgi:hypothetical protein
VISGFRHEVDENCALLGYYAACCGNFRPFVKMRPKICPETSVLNFHNSLRNNPEEYSFLFLTESLHAIPEFNLIPIATLTKFWLVCIFPKMPFSVCVNGFDCLGVFTAVKVHIVYVRRTNKLHTFFIIDLIQLYCRRHLVADTEGGT